MVRKTLIVCGAISSILYLVSIDVIAALQHPEYHNYTAQMVSELMAVGAPTRRLLIYLFIPYNLLVFAFAAGVWLCARKPATSLTSAALLGYAVVSTAGLLLYPMDLRGTIASQRDGPHIVATVVLSLFVMAAMVCGAFVRGRRFRLYSLATLATVVAFGTLAGFLAHPMPGPTPWIGLAERVNIYATMLWILLLSVTLLTTDEGPSAKPARPV
jgi:hypothetical protein